MPGLQLMDTTIRDGQQSLWATRMQLGDMLPILPKMDKVGYWAIEAWGGATFDTCLRFLDENPWERLRSIKRLTPNTDLSMLTRGQNLVGYKHYSKDIINRFTACAKKNGVQVFRVFDALNDIRNVIDSAEAVKACGGWFEPAISYTVSPVHTLDAYIEYAQQLKDLGADSIAIKDMAGMLTPYRTERLVSVLNAEVGLPVHLHCHYVGGMAPTNILKAAEAGVAVADTASAPLAFGNSHPAVETVVAALRESKYDTGYDIDLLFEIADYWEEVRKRGHYNRGVTSLAHMKVFSHQVPGGMMSNLVAQLEIQKATDRLDEVLVEIPKVRAEVGYPPLVTPMSQIVGTQAVLNVLTGSRWSIVSKEMKDYLCGYYGKAPGPIDPDVFKKVVGASDSVLPPDVSPASLVTTTYDEVAEEIGDLAQSEEDVLMYALFPNEARNYLSKHRATEKVEFLLENESNQTKEDDYVDISQIRELAKVVEDSGVGEITVEEDGMRISIRMPGAAPAASAAAAPVAAAAPAAQPAAAPAAAPAAEEDSRPANWVKVSAPMVGTFYAAPAPGEPAFVKVGDEVAAGETLCIVEAMKLMNEIGAPQMGIVREICVEDASPVEYGTALFYIEPYREADAGEGA
ncbi:MAG: acetyl-CoA carboxylase biotin carboxyl carrier protein [Slackia sp.]|uniref:acetyl-CoA carboxylase biotin carboxyl carrier protein n=1 Tax=Slackia exigua TaxID=84109 RepID=UPI002006417F|nr:acetyl-CoA carboxylase biotin carboxyl carrier protein [Slackia exigua]MCK6138811.1 acetyl-CoA carboxylase biotin carboxyl carrier protein [Slackia exigua]MCQ5090672.1 acetyl-CoA carboxylase biotin carboxyl carrier protein [Slackia exigua]MDU5612446.1 acetyl-CoA carboxylase biotin carboxyl carrier protein [Slackia sp.]MDU6011371.1 acetyl-CoA carboxylase biotin carboxyl carrier protein [Slackia sp.]